MESDVARLRREVSVRESELAHLRAQLAKAEEAERSHAGALTSPTTDAAPIPWPWPLEEHEYQRYGRQMVVPGYGLEAQLRLKRSRVLVVGAGGLGCPAAAYLAGAGVGTLGLVDADTVELSNLHRQVAHSTSRVGMSKVQSALVYLRDLNPMISYRAHEQFISPQNAHSIVAPYDVVLDCTDHPTSRHLLSDICVLLDKPLVSASALQNDGQLVLLNDPPKRGPCYRCLFPRPPPPESVVACGEGGILGPVVGVMGVLQALEAIKLITREPGTDSTADQVKTKGVKMTLFSAGRDGLSFRSVGMRGRRADCFACSQQSSLTLPNLAASVDYVRFCGAPRPVEILAPEERVSISQFCKVRDRQPQHVLLDVREKEHFSLGSIPGAINVPLSRLHRSVEMPDLTAARRIFAVCRVGRDSQLAVRKLKDMGLLENDSRSIEDIEGGIKAWKDQVDASIPFL